jgi:hypothetical protein
MAGDWLSDSGVLFCCLFVVAGSLSSGAWGCCWLLHKVRKNKRGKKTEQATDIKDVTAKSQSIKNSAIDHRFLSFSILVFHRAVFLLHMRLLEREVV